jgi:hypothetical protein
LLAIGVQLNDIITPPQQLISISFTSDIEQVLISPYPLDFTTFETGSLQDVTSFFTNLTGSGLTVLVQSDVTPVPEPSTGVLGLTAVLIAFSTVLWRRSGHS